ncbi:alpha/beta hydrolase [Streptomyces sp. NBC_00873]|uniref:alpha/beta fold hydrolase n=1 Tax=unclassified Streptomyces TaxID=2593676 RepID=UPI00386F8960|nr:alpha/beta hydrolase [Streptomyces sp. NBC_00873]WTA48039.1 alpha/beta hydrolase [Streptomyces sp. NBC_00842]
MTAWAISGTRRRILRAHITVAGCALALCASAAAPAAAEGDTTVTKPTVVLVHGAFADGSSWNGVISRLERSGYTVIAPANPLRGLYSDSTYIASVLDSIKGPVVLVGHSYGGSVISSAAAGNPRVKSLVYVSALMPDVGESGMSLAARFPTELGTATTSVPYRENGRSGTDLHLKRDKVHQVFAADLPVSEANLLAATQRPAATTAFSEKAKVAAWKHIPSWTLVGRQDKTISPDQERFQAKRAGSHTVEINSSHVSLIAHPAAVADLILQAAGAPSSARPSRAVAGSANDVRAKAALAGFAGASLAAGAGAVLLGRRLRRTRR